jgi:hypothetical protein
MNLHPFEREYSEGWSGTDAWGGPGVYSISRAFPSARHGCLARFYASDDLFAMRQKKIAATRCLPEAAPEARPRRTALYNARGGYILNASVANCRRPLLLYGGVGPN